MDVNVPVDRFGGSEGEGSAFKVRRQTAGREREREREAAKLNPFRADIFPGSSPLHKSFLSLFLPPLLSLSVCIRELCVLPNQESGGGGLAG